MKNHQGRYCPVALALMAALWPQAGWSESYFNPAVLSDDTASVADLSRFEQGHQQAPGVYRVDIWRNDEFIGTQDVRFEQAENTPPVAGGLSACITRAMLRPEASLRSWRWHAMHALSATFMLLIRYNGVIVVVPMTAVLIAVFLRA